MPLCNFAITPTTTPKMKNLNQHLEAMIFASEEAITNKSILETLQKTYEFDLDEERIDSELSTIKARYQGD